MHAGPPAASPGPCADPGSPGGGSVGWSAWPGAATAPPPEAGRAARWPASAWASVHRGPGVASGWARWEPVPGPWSGTPGSRRRMHRSPAARRARCPRRANPSVAVPPHGRRVPVLGWVPGAVSSGARAPGPVRGSTRPPDPRPARRGRSASPPHPRSGRAPTGVPRPQPGPWSGCLGVAEATRSLRCPAPMSASAAPSGWHRTARTDRWRVGRPSLPAPTSRVGPRRRSGRRGTRP